MEIVRFLLAAALLGPLIGVLLFFVFSTLFEQSQITGSLLISPVILYISLWFAPCGLAGGLLMLAWRKMFAVFDIFAVMLCGLLGGFLPVFILSFFLGDSPSFLIGAVAGLIGAMTALILWCSRGLLRLKAL